MSTTEPIRIVGAQHVGPFDLVKFTMITAASALLNLTVFWIAAAAGAAWFIALASGWPQ